MKLLTDFDGVWTYPEAEGRAQGEVLEGLLLEWTPEARRPEVSRWLSGARAEVSRQPAQYGWESSGRVSALGDEDPFIVHSGLLSYIAQHRDRDATARSLVEAAAEHGFSSLDALGGHSHAEGVRRVVETRGPGILPEAAEAGRRMLAAGIEVVAVSNSTTDKLMRWFEHAGVPCREHPDRAEGALRVRGSARKFVLAAEAERALRLGGIRFDLARPSYQGVLEDERPEAIVGDVFSLDLALPLALKRDDPAWSGTRLFWIIHPYTPEWLVGLISEHAPEVESIRGGLKALADRLCGPQVRRS